MFELAKRYSEEQYYRKEDVMKEIDFYLFHPVWEEITRYRAFFKKEYTLLENRYDLVFHQRTINQILKTQQGIRKAIMRKQTPRQDAFPQSLQSLFIILSGQKDENIWFPYAIQQEVIPIRESLLQFLCDEDEIWLVRLFFLMACYKGEKKEELCMLFLMKEGYSEYFDFFLHSWDEGEKEVGDMTYYFLDYLNTIWLKTDYFMNHKKEDAQDRKEMLFEELQETYPYYNDEQLHFYIEHRQIKRYYTIRQYMEFCHVCYETARYSMEQFVQQNWYQKQKLGKKFVFKVL